MASQPAQELDWRTLKASDIPSLTLAQLKALSEARKRDTLLAKSSPAVAAADNAPSGPSSAPDRSSEAGPSRTTRQGSQRLTPYARTERDPKSLEVRRNPLRTARNAPQTSKSVNASSLQSSPEPEEGDVAASEENIRDTIEMMRAMQRENDALEKENEALVLQTQKMRALAKDLQSTLTAERYRTDRILTYLKNWQRTSNDWTFESIFPRKDVILMTKMDEEAGTTETREVDLEDAETIPELKRFLEDSIETPGNLTDAVLQSIPPDTIVDFGTRNSSNEAQPESEVDNVVKGKGKARDTSFRPNVGQSSGQGSKKRHLTEENVLEILNRQVLLVASQKSKEKYSNETRHFTNLQASGSGSSPNPAKRRKLEHQGISRADSIASFPLENEGPTNAPASSSALPQREVTPPIHETNGPIDTPRLEKSDLYGNFAWNEFGHPVIDMPRQSEMPLGDYVTLIRRAVQFIEAGPPPGFVLKEEIRRGKPLRREKYRKFEWSKEGIPDIDIPKFYDPEHISRLLEAVKFLGTEEFEPRHTPEPEKACEPLEHEDSVRTLSVDGLRCSWTSSGLPVVTFTHDGTDDPQYIDNILLASDFILRGPGPDEKWEGKDQLPDQFRGHLPKDPMVICTHNFCRQPDVKLPPPTSPCYYDRIIISAKFIRAEREATDKKSAISENKAHNTALELARQLAEDDDETLNADVSEAQRRQIHIDGTVVDEEPTAEEPVEQTIEETITETITENAVENPVEQNIEETIAENAVEDPVDEIIEEPVAVQETKKAGRTTRAKTTKKSGKR